MTFYRSLEVINAVQYTGEDIPGVTCSGSDEEFRANGCDSSRRKHTHVHTQAIGGMTVLQSGDWIFPLPGGPFGVASDQKFRGRWEVPVRLTAEPVPPAEPETPPSMSPSPAAPAPPSVPLDVVLADEITAPVDELATDQQKETTKE